MANKNISGSCYDFSSQYDMNKNFYVIYITNYGRLIKSETVMFYISKQNKRNQLTTNKIRLI